MNVNKKLDRFKQWAGERMGAEAKTNVSDDFKALETEMGFRHEGMDKMHKSMNLYVKTLSKRNEGDDKEKNLPMGYLAKVMVTHGQEFENNSEFGQCLTSFGHTHDGLARLQETYIANASATWLDSLERSLAQMKEYQAARKKLETRRLAYDTSLTKLERQKKEDFRVEEELRNARAKFDETTDDVYRRMQDIKETEGEGVADLEAFLEAELTYHEKCRESLLRLKQEWPTRNQHTQMRTSQPNPRPRANTASQTRCVQRYAPAEDLSPPPSPEMEAPPKIRSASRSLSNRFASEHRVEPAPATTHRPPLARSTTCDPAQIKRDPPPALNTQRLTRVPSDSFTVRTQRSQLRSINRAPHEGEVFDDQTDSTFSGSSPDRSYGDASPATSNGSVAGARIRGPPPPPPSRAKKPPPPPPPAKRTLLV